MISLQISLLPLRCSFQILLLQPNSLQCWLSLSIDFFSVNEIWVFVCIVVFLLSISRMVAIAAYVNNLDLNLFSFSPNKLLFLMLETYCEVFHILGTSGYFPQRRHISHSRRLLANTKALNLGYGLLLCVYFAMKTMDYCLRCGIIRSVQFHTLMLLFSSHLIPVLLFVLIQSFHQGY